MHNILSAEQISQRADQLFWEERNGGQLTGW